MYIITKRLFFVVTFSGAFVALFLFNSCFGSTAGDKISKKILCDFDCFCLATQNRLASV
jgi:hypothetical protein